MSRSDRAVPEDEHARSARIDRQLREDGGRLAVRLVNGTQLIGRLVGRAPSRAITIESQGDEMTVAVAQIESIEVI
jgi:hypothetical protein